MNITCDLTYFQGLLKVQPLPLFIFQSSSLLPTMAGEGGRVFALAGFLPSPLPLGTPLHVQREKEEEMEKEKSRVIAMIRKLGGVFNGGEEWNPSTTHVINYVDGTREGLSEKVMAGIAAGKWVVTKRYVEKSLKAGYWLDKEAAYTASPKNQILALQERVKLHGESGRLFHGMVAAMVLEERAKAAVYTRIIRAGGGKVVAAKSLLGLAASVPSDLTHVFLDPWFGHKDPPGFAQMTKIEGLHLCDYKLLYNMVRGTPNTSEKLWNITGAKAKQEAKDREKRNMSSKQKGNGNRGKRLAEQEGQASKRRRTHTVETVNLDSDSDDDQGANLVPLVDVDLDSDDDIQILETRLDKQRKETHGRQYHDREKAKGVRATNYSKICAQQREEILGASRVAKVNIVSLSDDDDEVQVVSRRKSKTEEVTILDSDEEVTLVQDLRRTQNPKRMRRYASISTPSRSPSPPRMQVEQDERGGVSSADELDELDEVTARPTREAPMIELVDLDDESTDDEGVGDLDVAISGPPDPPPPPNISLQPLILSSEQKRTSAEITDLTPSQISWLLPLPILPKPAIKPVSERRPLLDEQPVEENVLPCPSNAISVQTRPSDLTPQQKVLFIDRNLPISPNRSPERADLEISKSGQQEVLSTSSSPPETLELDKSVKLASNEEAQHTNEREVGESDINEPTDIASAVGLDDKKTSRDGDGSQELSSATEKGSRSREEVVAKEVSPILYTEQRSENEELEIELLSQETPRTNESYSDRVVWKPKAISLQETDVPCSSFVPDSEKSKSGNKPIHCLSNKPFHVAPKTSALSRIVATLQRRFSSTDENIAISNINCRTARFDKHNEGTGRAGFRQIAQSVEQDFASQLVTTPTTKGKRHEAGRQRKGKTGKTLNQLVEPEEDGEVCPEDIETALKRLAIETSSDAHPSPALLHTVMINLLLDARHSAICSSAHSYLLHFLFLHAHRGRNPDTRKQWVHLVLSAFRDISDEKLFRQFDIENQHDIHSCLQLWKKLFQRLLATLERCDNESERHEDREGPWLLLSFLTLLLQRDFEMWWKHGRKKGEKDFPLLFYLLGGRSHILSSASTSLLTLFKTSLTIRGVKKDLSEVRQLVAMVALLLSHLDSEDSNANLCRGSKVQFASRLATIIQEADLDPKSTFLELSLMQPAWLAVLVSRELLLRSSPGLKKISLEYISPILQLPELSTANKLLTVVTEIWAQRLLGVHKASAIFRRNWTLVQTPEKSYSAFTMLHKLEDRELCKEMRSLKIEEVSVKMAHVTCSVNKLSEFANQKEQFGEDTDVGALRALLFKMRLPDAF